MRRLFRLFRLLCGDRRGGVAVWFAVAAVPSAIAATASIDYARWTMIRSRLGAAADAAVLAATTPFWRRRRRP